MRQFRSKIKRHMTIVTAGLLAVSTLSHQVLAQEEEKQPEEPPSPEIELSRVGHADVSAEHRILSWFISDPSGIAEADVRIMKIEMGTMKPQILLQTDEWSGEVDVAELQKGPGLYAIIAKARDNENNENTAGLRFSYTEVRKECPAEKAWWPERG